MAAHGEASDGGDQEPDPTRVVLLRQLSGQLVGGRLRTIDTVLMAREQAAKVGNTSVQRVTVVGPNGQVMQDDEPLAAPGLAPGEEVTLQVIYEPMAEGGVRGDPRRGLSMSFLRNNLVADLDIGATETVIDIIDRICAKGEGVRCPRDNKNGAAYVDVAEDNHAGSATLMLSYTWGYKVSEILSALRLYCDKKSLPYDKTCIWMCCFCVNQHRVRELRKGGQHIGGEDFMRKFLPLFTRGAPTAAPIRVVGLLSPWSKPTYLNRIWCLFEAWKASKGSPGLELDFMLPESEVEQLQASMLKESWWSSIQKGLSNIKVELAGAAEVADLEQITEFLKEDGGTSQLEPMLRKKLQKWYVDEARNYPQVTPGAFFEPRACTHLADWMTLLGDKDCIGFLKESISFCEQRSGGGGPQDAETTNVADQNIDLASLHLRLGRNLGTSGDQAGALKHCQIADEFCKRARKHPMDFSMMEAEVSRTLASISRKNGDLEEAFRQYSKCLVVYEMHKNEEDGWMHKASGWILLNIGIVWGLLKEGGREVPECDDALKPGPYTTAGYVDWDDLQYFAKAWEIYEHYHEGNQPTAAWLIRNRGVSHLRAKRLAEAKADFAQAHKIYEDHSLTDVENFGELRRSQGMLYWEESKFAAGAERAQLQAEAAKCFEDACRVLREVVSPEVRLINMMNTLNNFYMLREDVVSAKEVLKTEHEMRSALLSEDKRSRVDALQSQCQQQPETLGAAAQGPHYAVADTIKLPAPTYEKCFVSEDGKVRLDVPPGAVDPAVLSQFVAPRLLSASEIDRCPHLGGDRDRCSEVYELAPGGISFSEPVLLRMAVTRRHPHLGSADDNGGDACLKGMRIVRLEDGASDWNVIRHCWLDKEGYVCAWIPGFSKFVLQRCYPALRVARLVDRDVLKVSVAFGLRSSLPPLEPHWELVELQDCIGQYCDGCDYKVLIKLYDADAESNQKDETMDFHWRHDAPFQEKRFHFATKFHGSRLVRIRIEQDERELANWVIGCLRPTPTCSAGACRLFLPGWHLLAAMFGRPVTPVAVHLPPTAAPSAAPETFEGPPLVPLAGLVIGNNEYTGRMKPLAYAIRDAERVRERLVNMSWDSLPEQGMFFHTDVRCEDFRGQCKDFTQYVREQLQAVPPLRGDKAPCFVVFVFFAGHGTVQVNDGDLHLWPVDALDHPTSMSLRTCLLRDLKDLKVARSARLVCVLCLDCCRERLEWSALEAFRSWASAAFSGGGASEEADKNGPSRTELITAWSCDTGQRALESAEYCAGYFTHFLLQQLGERDEDLLKVLHWVTDKVVRKTLENQAPCVDSIRVTGEIRLHGKRLQNGKERWATIKPKAKAACSGPSTIEAAS